MASVLFSGAGGGQVGFACVSERVRSRGRASLCDGDAGVGLAVRLCVECDQFTALGTAHPGGFGISVFGGRCDVGLLDVERFSTASREMAERLVHVGVGIATCQRTGAIASCDDLFEAPYGESIVLSHRN